MIDTAMNIRIFCLMERDHVCCGVRRTRDSGCKQFSSWTDLLIERSVFFVFALFDRVIFCNG